LSERAHLSIGEVLSLLREEFPDVTISKIRFLESQGLVDPERTPSGYRKFYDPDVERLRWILRQQREHFLPLKVIKGRLSESSAEPDEPAEAEADAAAAVNGGPAESDAEPAEAGERPAASVAAGRSGPSGRMAAAEEAASAAKQPFRRAEDRPPPPDTLFGDRTPAAASPSAGPPDAGGSSLPRSAAATGAGTSGPGAAPSGKPASDTSETAGTGATAATAVSAPPAPTPPAPTSSPAPTPPAPTSSPAATSSPAPAPTAKAPPSRSGPAQPVRRRVPPSALSRGLRPDPDELNLTLDELVAACGLDANGVHELEGFGLISSRDVGGTTYYDQDALAVANLAAGFASHGIGARHLRMYKNAAERESGLFEQIVMPLIKQRNPKAREQAGAALEDLARLGGELRQALLNQSLRDAF
jgi:DNA-binding transcriptional MerR regulator